ncbi:hypothetical protein [Caballeronia sp. LZ035]|uniref:hypothetical protein n=1 Tax=Caballeronia sp. LZ035 TaxID=3038568 RepID=UPI00285CEE24|nr:hypothetical protein [Caballeronia sp. LZ035]MDR5762906.1 hypothetical protein [Caballeronia sp. LZ035]
MLAAKIMDEELMADLDVCPTPTSAGPVTTPYPNLAMLMIGVPPAETVVVGNAPASTWDPRYRSPMAIRRRAGRCGIGAHRGSGMLRRRQHEVLIGGNVP